MKCKSEDARSLQLIKMIYFNRAVLAVVISEDLKKNLSKRIWKAYLFEKHTAPPSSSLPIIT